MSVERSTKVLRAVLLSLVFCLPMNLILSFVPANQVWAGGSEEEGQIKKTVAKSKSFVLLGGQPQSAGSSFSSSGSSKAAINRRRHLQRRSKDSGNFDISQRANREALERLNRNNRLIEGRYRYKYDELLALLINYAYLDDGGEIGEAPKDARELNWSQALKQEMAAVAKRQMPYVGAAATDYELSVFRENSSLLTKGLLLMPTKTQLAALDSMESKNLNRGEKFDQLDVPEAKLVLEYIQENQKAANYAKNKEKIEIAVAKIALADERAKRKAEFGAASNSMKNPAQADNSEKAEVNNNNNDNDDNKNK